MVARNVKLMRSRTEAVVASRPYFDNHVQQEIMNIHPVINVLSPNIAIQAWNGKLAATDKQGVTLEPKISAVTVGPSKKENGL